MFRQFVVFAANVCQHMSLLNSKIKVLFAFRSWPSTHSNSEDVLSTEIVTITFVDTMDINHLHKCKPLHYI